MKIQQMANAINHNLEMFNAVQVSLHNNFRADDNQGNLIQGETLKTDLHIAGTKIYTDAAWKIKNIPGSQGTISTGLGVYCDIQEQDYQGKILIQAATSTKASSPLLAEAMGLNLATQIVKKLQIHEIIMLTDNLTLSRAAAANNISDKRVPWELRDQIANYHRESNNLQVQVYHIKRDLNGVAHNCATQAIRQDVSWPIFSCSNSAHTRIGSCPTVSTLKTFCSPGIVILAVHCI